MSHFLSEVWPYLAFYGVLFLMALLFALALCRAAAANERPSRPSGVVVSFPARLRLVTDALDEAGDGADDVWPVPSGDDPRAA